MTNQSFEGRVAIVTGAGSGLGRSHALELARRGAQLVVNDIACDNEDGSFAAERVVDEIAHAGGCAIADTNPVENGSAIVESALSKFGRIDIIVNNAGILRNSMFHKMTATDWDAVYDVHLLGAFAVTHAAWPHMRRQEYGRIIMTASGSGLYGNFGQTNYSAVKLALHGMAQALALEGRPKGICVNTIAPIAVSGLTKAAMSPEMVAGLQPSLVSPLVALLSSEDCPVTGQVFEVGGGWVTRLRWQQSRGAFFNPKTGFSMEDLKENWSEVQSFDSPYYPEDVYHTLRVIGENIGTEVVFNVPKSGAQS